MAVSGNTLLVGAPQAGFQNKGQAYFYERVEASWTPKGTWQGAQTYTYFGQSVAIYGDTAVVGTPYDNGNAGRAFVFERTVVTGMWAQKATTTIREGPQREQMAVPASRRPRSRRINRP